MRKLLSFPVQLTLSETENTLYQNALKYVADIALNLMAVKVDNRPEDFLGWCSELNHLCRHGINMELLDDHQHKPLKKLQETLQTGISLSQLKMLKIAPWPIFSAFIGQHAKTQCLDERLKLVSYIARIRETPLAEMIEEDRLAFAGKHTSKHDTGIYPFDVEWFATTKGAKDFHLLLQSQPEKFDLALSHIPLSGEVTSAHYQAFVNAYQDIFNSQGQGESAPLMPATRLLAMRRPDQFVALTNANADIICRGLGLAKLAKNDFDAYWHEVITSIRSFAWWHQEMPSDEHELLLWQSRALLIELFLYADETLKTKSNYLKLINRKTGSGRTAARQVKRSKASAEELVDKALAEDGIPDYILGKRDSIVHQVKEGKSVEQVIGLMRAIFG